MASASAHIELVRSTAKFSPCRTYRYTLHRIWNEALPPAMFIGLNPSTADEVKNDPTVRRCINFAIAWGYGGLIMTNIFALRSTDPNGLTRIGDPVGPRNDYWLKRSHAQAGVVVAAWGIWGQLQGRGAHVRALLPKLQCLGTTKGGDPRHPLYLRGDLRPVPLVSHATA